MTLIDRLKDWYRFLNPKFQNLFLEFPVKLKPRYSSEHPHELLFKIINSNRSEYSVWIDKMQTYQSVFATWKQNDQNTDDLQPSWNNGFFPALDMMILYTMVSDIKPQKYVEIGSGNSTKVVAQAIKDQKLNTQVVSIDPTPRALIDQISDQIIRKGLEEIDLEPILTLSAGDILFIDNSHRILPNSDAMTFYMDILPALSKGVFVHIHDIYLPYDYPQFMCDRFYSEQYGLAINLMANSQRYHSIMPCFFISEDTEFRQQMAPLWAMPQLQQGEKHGGSFWLQIR
jgi:predicted O-methyltransferase YrrM